MCMCRAVNQSPSKRPPVRRSASSSVMPHRHQLQELTPSRLSPHAVHGPSPAVMQDKLSWENELLQMQIASSALIKPLGDAASTSIADPQIIAEVTIARHREQSPDLTAFAKAQSQSATHPAQEHWRDSEPLEAVNLQETSADPSSQRLLDATMQAKNLRSTASPFFAAAQRFTLLNNSTVTKGPPPPLSIPGGQDTQPICVGLALQRQTETAEVVIPSPSFTSLTSPILLQHPFSVLPLSPQTTAKGFVAADSFKHEPGTTLLDCTEPTPRHSIDLDDSRLNRLAQLLPNLPFPPNKRVKRNLSCQLASLSEGIDGGEDASRHGSLPLHDHGLATGPDEGAGSLRAALNQVPGHWKRGTETANTLDCRCSQAGDDLAFKPYCHDPNMHSCNTP